jgi:protein-L-isoaspartate O-methyltransferase
MTKLFVALVAIALAAQPCAAQQQQTAKPEHMDHKFDDPARFAKAFDDPARDAWQMPSRVIGALELRPGMKAADIGAGTGYFSTRLARVPGVAVFAVDIEPKMLDYLKQRAQKEKLDNVTAVLAGPTSPNLPEPVDVILVVDTYHHLPDRSSYFPAGPVVVFPRAPKVAQARWPHRDRRLSRGRAGRATRALPFYAAADSRRDDAGGLRAAVVARLPAATAFSDFQVMRH